MKKLKLFLAVCALLVGGVNSASAYDTTDLVSAGWEAVDGTTVTLTDLDNYYFILVDGTETNKSLTYSGIGTDARPVYQLLYDPTVSIGQVWKLEASNDMFKLKAYANDWYYCSNSWGWNSYVGASESYTEHEFVQNEGKYYIHVKDEGGTTRALGAWSNYDLSGGGLGYAGTAGNKDVGGSNDRGFYIYRIARTDFTPAAKPSAQYAAAGWMEVTALDDWGRDGIQYVFLDVSVTGFETEMVMTATENGLPQYQRNDMADERQWWTTEASGSGYALKSIGIGKYSNYTAPWGGNMSDTQPGNVFVPSIPDGKWQIKNTSDNNNWLGRWGDSDNGKNGKNDPFAGEQLAANKSADNGKRLFAVYAIPTAVSMAEALPATGDMAADTWYYFDIAIAGSSYAATATALADIECVEYATGNAVTLTETANSLAATRYYVKSATDNNLAVAATAFSYEIDAATADPADGSIIKAGDVITVTFNALTDDPGATPTVDFSGVTFNGNAAAITTSGTGFTFVVPDDVTAATSYTLEIPAGAVQYVGEASSAAATFTYTTPVIANGWYYMRNTDPSYENKYLARGGNWATQAITGDFGLAVNLTMNDGKYTIQFFDNDMYIGDDGNCYTDCTGGRVRSFTVEKVPGGYKFMNTNNSKYLAVYQGAVVADAVEGDNLEGNTNVWALETPDEYAATCYARNAQAQVVAAATAAGLTGITTGADLEAAFPSTKAITIPTVDRTSANNKYAPETQAGGVYNYFEKEVTGLADGVYKLSFKAMQRGSGYARVDKAFGARGLLYAYANDAKTQLVSAMEQGAATAYESNYYSERTGLNYPNNSGSTYTAFDAGLYDNEVYVYVTGGTLKFGINNPSRLAGNFDCYTVYGDFALTYYYDLTTLVAAYEAALANAKTTSAKTDKMAASLRTALDNAVNTYDTGNVDESSEAALEEATDALMAATSKAETSIASYAILAQGGLPDNSVDGWAQTNNGDLKINTWSNNVSNDDGGSGMTTPFIENWIYRDNKLGAGKLYYRLEGIEPGEVYIVEMNVRACNEADNTAPVDPVFYVNTTTVDFTTVATLHQDGSWASYFGVVSAAGTVGDDGVLEFGIETTSACNYNWNAVKDVKVKTFDALLAEAIAAVEAFEGKVSSTVYATNHIADCQGANYPTTAAEFESAIAALKQDAETFNALVMPYADFLALKAIADFNATTTSDTDNSAFTAAITTAETAANVAMTPDDIEAASTQLKTDMNTYVDTATPVGDGQKFNLTYKLTYPDVTDLPSWQPVPGGWYTDQTDGNFQVMNNDAVNATDGSGKTKFVEYWSFNAKANDAFDLYQKVMLPEGTYQLSCYAVAKDEGHDGETKAGVYFYVDDTQGSLVDNDHLAPKEVEFVNATEHEVKIGLKSMNPNTYNWVGIGYVELYKVPAKAYTVDETVAWDNTTAGAGDVTLNRTIKAGFNTLVLPFSMTQAEVESNFGANSKVYVINAYDAAAENISFSTYDGISANKPCLLKATVPGSAYTLESRMIVAGIPVVEGTDVTMTGNYDASFEVPYDNYIINSDKIYLVDSYVTLKNTCAYISVTASAPARVLTMSFDGETTGIATLENGKLNVENGNIYDLSGRRVNSMAKGIYVVNGKKIVK